MNRDAFFASVRASLFAGGLSQPQVDGLNALLDAYDSRKPYDVKRMAYILATALHETAATMQPIREYGHGKGKKYGVTQKDGQVPYGRGYVQLTWLSGYERADKELGMRGALVKNFDLALRPDVAASILFRGMEEGWFTGRKLSDYIKPDKTDYFNARRIVNGMDRAALIAGHAERFEAALVAAMAQPVTQPDDPGPAHDPIDPVPAKKHWLAQLVETLLGIFTRRNP